MTMLAYQPNLPATMSAIDLLLGGNRNPSTSRAYQQALRAFSQYLTGDPDQWRETAESFLSLGQGQASQQAMLFSNAMSEANLSKSTIMVRMAALSKLADCARMLGQINWDVVVDAGLIKDTRNEDEVRDTSGCSVEEVKAIESAIKSEKNPVRRSQDLALFSMLTILALRRGGDASGRLTGIGGLNVGDVDLEAPQPSLRYVCKGKDGKTKIALSDQVAGALKEWIDNRKGGSSDPLFVGIKPNGEFGKRLSGGMIWKVTKRWGEKAGVARCNPHSFRHYVGTRVAEETNGDLGRIRDSLGHSGFSNLQTYVDTTAQRQIESQQMLAGSKQ